MATVLVQRMAEQVGRDGVPTEWERTDMLACAQAFYNRVLASEGVGGIPSHQRRDRRESETLCAVLDMFAIGRSGGSLGAVFLFCRGCSRCLVFAGRCVAGSWFVVLAAV